MDKQETKYAEDNPERWFQKNLTLLSEPERKLCKKKIADAYAFAINLILSKKEKQ
jgi:hypothetical protein